MKKKIVINGDAIEGNHHGSIQIISPNPKHHVEIFVELITTFLHKIGFSVKNGDEFDIVSGTESHTGWMEYEIANQLSEWGARYHDELKVNVNGKYLWWVHQGARPGRGANEGNALRNWGRDLYFDCLKYGKQPPHMVTMSHFHKNTYEAFNDSYRHTMHLQVLPSWQGKTRFGYKASPFQRNDIGMIYNVITADGDIRIHEPLLWDKSA